MTIHPIDERLLIKPEEQEERKVGSLFIPDTAAKERPQIGKVIAMGDDIDDESRKKLSELVKVGDRIVFAKYGGTEIKIDDEDYLLVNRSDVLAVVKD